MLNQALLKQMNKVLRRAVFILRRLLQPFQPAIGQHPIGSARPQAVDLKGTVAQRHLRRRERQPQFPPQRGRFTARP